MLKALSIILSFLIFNFSCFAQREVQNIIFEDAIRSLSERGTILYVERSMNYFGLISNVSKRGRLAGYSDTTRVSLRLEKKEIRALDNEFKRDSVFAWKANLFENSFMTSLDSANYYRLKFMREQNGKMNKRYFFFSRVVYFRDNLFAVFRLAEMYGPSAGYDYLFVYQKTNDVWSRYMKVYMGAW